MIDIEGIIGVTYHIFITFTLKKTYIYTYRYHTNHLYTTRKTEALKRRESLTIINMTKMRQIFSKKRV